MKKCFLDTNVILDLMLKRRDWEFVAQLSMKALKNEVACYCSYLSIADIAYILRKSFSLQEIKSALREILTWCEVVTPGAMDVAESLRLDHPDYEDCLQILIAESKRCDLIITSNIAHFKGYTDIPVCSPSEMHG